MANPRYIVSLMAERMQLASIYAEDGAPRRAAEVLRELAIEVDAYADRRDAAFAQVRA
jgi:hypothetical protein